MIGVGISTLGCITELFLAVYGIITLSDLETDLINSRKCCDSLNKVGFFLLITFIIIIFSH